MLTDKVKIKLLEKKVNKLEKQMLFIIEMIGAPDAAAYKRGLKKMIKKQEQDLLKSYLKGGKSCA